MCDILWPEGQDATLSEHSEELFAAIEAEDPPGEIMRLLGWAARSAGETK